VLFLPNLDCPVLAGVANSGQESQQPSGLRPNPEFRASMDHAWLQVALVLPLHSKDQQPAIHTCRTKFVSEELSLPYYSSCSRQSWH
jgi:hypothetical protein